MAEMNETIAAAITSKFPDWYTKRPPLISKSEYDHFRDEVNTIYKTLNYHPQTILEEATVAQLLDLKPDSRSFIQKLSCARTWSDSILCANITQIDSVKDRQCTTLMHKGVMLNDLVHRPHFFNNSKASTDNFDYFGAKELIKVVLNFQPEDYGDLRRQIGASVTIHDNAHVGSRTNIDFYVNRGYRYEFRIDRTDTKLMQKPYGGCFDYSKHNLDKFRYKIEPRIALSSTTCFQNCVSRNIIKQANCWPPSVPYFRNDSLDPELNLRNCVWYKGDQVSIFTHISQIDYIKNQQKKNTTDKTFLEGPVNGTVLVSRGKKMREYRKVSRFCLEQCTLPCTVTTYSVSVTKTAWPSEVQILFDKSGKERLLRHCCALLVFKYSQYHYNVKEYKAKHQLSDTIGDMGGLLAVWLGLSIVSVYRAIQKLVELSSRHLKSRKLYPLSTT